MVAAIVVVGLIVVVAADAAVVCRYSSLTASTRACMSVRKRARASLVPL